MGYSELIKSFERIRRYMQQFYIYGFKSRIDFSEKSARSYDNEKRRIESYLSEYMRFKNKEKGKNVFISMDSRSVRSNPFYKALKSKSFTNGDITLHFILLDILNCDTPKTLKEITALIDEKYLSSFYDPQVYDDSTVRIKLKEYCKLGIFSCEKSLGQIRYKRSSSPDITSWQEALSFFSETSPCGVFGSYLLDRLEVKSNMAFKHHYIASALDSEVLCGLFNAIHEKRELKFKYHSLRSKAETIVQFVPIKVYISVQSGRQYIYGYNIENRRIKVYRIDFIKDVKIGEVYSDFDSLSADFDRLKDNLWGVSLGNCKNTQRVELIIHIGDNEEYIYKRLLREKRCGTVERTDKHTAKFYADVFDSVELIPWIRSFICRIKSVYFSDCAANEMFYKDLQKLYNIYDIGGDDNALS